MFLSIREQLMTLSISAVEKRYEIVASNATVHALNGIDIILEPGKTLGIVGESGCGKSTLARLIVGLESPSAGSVRWNGKEVVNLSRNSIRTHNSAIQLVFQDPYSSLNPRQRIGESIAEALTVLNLRHGDHVEARVDELLSLVGLATDLKRRYPHQLSGGQRQRVSICRALAAEPQLLVLDEPVSALDVSVRAEVMNLLIDLREKLGLTYIFISHDLAMINYISDYIAVMYLGKVVEYGTWHQVSSDPRHPYTEALLRAMPDHTVIGNPESLKKTISGEVPNPINLPTGCPFHLRCPIATPQCQIEVQRLINIDNGHAVACMEVSR